MQFYLFADDISVYYDSDDLINLQKIVNRELKKIKKWLDANRLALNITNTNYVIFHSPSKMTDRFIRIKLGSKSLERAKFVRYLGILVDSTMSWKPHVIELSKNWQEYLAYSLRLGTMFHMKL